LDNLTSSLDDLFSQYQNLDFSPERLEQINARLFSLSDLQHKYGKTTQEILSHLAEVKKKLSSLDSYADSLAELKKKEESLLREASSKGSYSFRYETKGWS
jgi:DNA repair protein RecN (Recombination protein N)